MNSHFQSSATTWISIGGTLETIGLGGSRSWLEIHAMPPRNMMTSAGIAHTTSSIGPEYWKVGRYCARLDLALAAESPFTPSGPSPAAQDDRFDAAARFKSDGGEWFSCACHRRRRRDCRAAFPSASPAGYVSSVDRQ